MFEHFRTCSNMLEHIRTCSNLLKVLLVKCTQKPFLVNHNPFVNQDAFVNQDPFVLQDPFVNQYFEVASTPPE